MKKKTKQFLHSFYCLFIYSHWKLLPLLSTEQPHLFELWEEITKSVQSGGSSLEIEHISYRNNVIHVASLIHDVPKYGSNNTIDSSSVPQSVSGEIHNGF